ncbi:cryptochrome/photolyase family protein [Halorhabdus amylolytica]|uniref:cryptochrome/photolyase family protein n=1 Tax=Halorhabdus amylolytica TaxID=2559573 RepID=UPI0010AB0E78|nr:deoxyribodipyrimidine photo-lyase [Halorhabdus amylolytica]
MRIHWHRRDLRLADNRALVGDGIDVSGPVVPVFVFDPAILEHASPPRIAFALDALASLREAYRDRGSDLLVRRGDPTDVLVTIAKRHDADVVTWNRDYSGLSRERDTAVRQALDAADIGREAVHDSVLHEPGTIRTNDGDPYQVFTYFWRKWKDREKAVSVDAPTENDLASIEDDIEIPALADLDVPEPEATIPEARPAVARNLLDDFCAEDIYSYEERRDFPADGCTSRLSPHLKFGTIGVREVYDATEAAQETAPNEEARESVEEFQSQLAWREFYAQVLWFNPEVVSENYKTYENAIEWQENPQTLQAWKDGMTGYPIVDAGMRQLREEAYMHNRVRMIVASFLTKDLLIDWREGYDWFREKLVDHDTANDNGGWQWAASTGTDAQPYFRIFNPMTQGERYDPDAEYIREYVPELAGVPADIVHSWHELDPDAREMHAPDYPAPIVDHGDRREQALATFERARGEE